MIADCTHCGAPLDVSNWTPLTRCAYCKHTQRTKTMHTQMRQTPIGWRPPPVWTPPMQYHVPHQPMQYSGVSKIVPFIIAFVIFDLVIGGVIFAAVMIGAFTSSTTTTVEVETPAPVRDAERPPTPIAPIVPPAPGGKNACEDLIEKLEKCKRPQEAKTYRTMWDAVKDQHPAAQSMILSECAKQTPCK